MSETESVDQPGIFLVGTGASTAVGTTMAQSASAVRARIARFVEHPHVRDRSGAPIVVALASYLPAGLSWIERVGALVLRASREARIAAVPTRPMLGKISVVIGVPEERPGLAGRWWTPLCERLQTEVCGGPGIGDVEVISRGHAAGILAMSEGCRRIQTREAEVVLVGGCECYLTRRTLAWLDAREQLKSELNRFGFVPGEAAGFCMLASAEATERYGLSRLARLGAVAATTEPSSHADTNRINVGRGLTDAIGAVLSRLRDGQCIDSVWCDLNGERHRTDEYGFTLSRLSEQFADPSAFNAPAASWGDVGAASGPLCAGLAVAAARRGYARGTTALVWASSASGARAALLLEAEVKRGRDGF